MAVGNQNYTTANLMALGKPAALSDAEADSFVTGVVATGSVVATAVTSVADIVKIDSAATGNMGFQLRSGLGFKRRQVVINLGPGSLSVYPPTGGTVNALSAVALASGIMGTFAAVNAAGTSYWKQD